MILEKYRMIYEDGSWVETLDIEEAETHGNYIFITENVIEDNIINDIQ